MFFLLVGHLVSSYNVISKLVLQLPHGTGYAKYMPVKFWKPWGCLDSEDSMGFPFLFGVFLAPKTEGARYQLHESTFPCWSNVSYKPLSYKIYQFIMNIYGFSSQLFCSYFF